MVEAEGCPNRRRKGQGITITIETTKTRGTITIVLKIIRGSYC
jgi:hypothetical protein